MTFRNFTIIILGCLLLFFVVQIVLLAQEEGATVAGEEQDPGNEIPLEESDFLADPLEPESLEQNEESPVNVSVSEQEVTTSLEESVAVNNNGTPPEALGFVVQLAQTAQKSSLKIPTLQYSQASKSTYLAGCENGNQDACDSLSYLSDFSGFCEKDVVAQVRDNLATIRSSVVDIEQDPTLSGWVSAVDFNPNLFCSVLSGQGWVLYVESPTLAEETQYMCSDSRSQETYLINQAPAGITCT